jgi:hypothetical protein
MRDHSQFVGHVLSQTRTLTPVTGTMSSTIQLPEDQLIELLLELKASNALLLPTKNHSLTVAENNSRPGKRNPQCSTSDCIRSGRPHGQNRHHRYPNISGFVHAHFLSLFSNSSSAANPSIICPSTKWDTSAIHGSSPSSSTGSEFAHWNSSIPYAPTWSVRRGCTTYRSTRISIILCFWIRGNAGANGPLQRAPSPATYQPKHSSGAGRHTGKPTGE